MAGAAAAGGHAGHLLEIVGEDGDAEFLERFAIHRVDGNGDVLGGAFALGRSHRDDIDLGVGGAGDRQRGGGQDRGCKCSLLLHKMLLLVK